MITLALISALVPLLFGGILLLMPEKKGGIGRKLLAILPSVVAFAASLLVTFGTETSKENVVTLFTMTSELSVSFAVDRLSCFFALLFSGIMTAVSLFSFGYFHNDTRKNRFDGFYLFSLGALLLLCYAGNLITMYVCFEAVTFLSMPLVLHDKTSESVNGALKYLIYSVSGAFLGFIGIVYLSVSTTGGNFTLGGILKSGVQNDAFFSVAIFFMLIGFGAKCGMVPLHNWLPTAHPVAPAPASAVLSGVITKSGVIAVIRIVYYTVGTEALRGTWVHKTWLWLILITVLLGSFMATVQKNFKKRLAFSTVSQVSYVLLGIAFFNETSLDGALLQIVSHGVIKVGLFLCAGAVIHLLDKHTTDELDGVGKQLPVTMWCYTVCSLGLVGVPPTIGFVAKWYLARGALQAEMGAFSYAAPIVLIVSAILTAYYLLSVTVAAFFPKNKEMAYTRVKEPATMWIPLVIMAALTVVLGIFPDLILGNVL